MAELCSHTFFYSHFSKHKNFSILNSPEQKSPGNHNPFTQVNTVSWWRRHSLGMFMLIPCVPFFQK